MGFLIDACSVLHADFGYIHLTTDKEMSDPSTPYDYTYAIDRGVTTHDLTKGIPNLSWAMVFGGPYTSLIDHFRRLSVANIRDLSEGRFYVQLTDSLDEIRNDYATFNDVRLRIRKGLGENFLSNSEGPVWRPTFKFKNAAG